MESKKNDDYDDGYKKVEMVDIKPDTTTESTDISTEKRGKEANTNPTKSHGPEETGRSSQVSSPGHCSLHWGACH